MLISTTSCQAKVNRVWRTLDLKAASERRRLAHPRRLAEAGTQTIARAKSAERLEGRCPVVAHNSLTPFSNENGVTLMAIE